MRLSLTLKETCFRWLGSWMTVIWPFMKSMLYVEDQIRRGIPMLPVAAGTLKNYGFAHEEVLKLTPHAKIFKEVFQPLIGKDQQLRKAVLKGDKAEIIKLTSADPILQQKLLQEMQRHQKTLDLMSDMDWKLSTFARYTPEEIDFYSECLVSYFDNMARKSPQEMIQALSQKSIRWNECFGTSFGASDKRYRLQLELHHRVWGDGKAKLWESGKLGTSPLSVLSLLKSDDRGGTNESVLRRRLYFLYHSNTLANEVMKEPGMAARLKCLLADRAVTEARESNPFLQSKDLPQIRKEAAFLNIGLIDVLRSRDPVKPLFQYGLYAYENERAKLRTPMSDSELEASKESDPNPYMGRGEEINPSDLNQRYRTQLSEQERRVITGHSSSRSIADELDLDRSMGAQHPSRISFAESVEEYRMRTERLPWCSGRHVFKLDDQASSEYLKAVRELGLPTLAGISGTLDQSTTMAGIVSIGMDREELENLRLAYIAWMVSSDDHSLHEIMVSGKTFGLPYTPRPNGYDDVAPSKPLFSQRVGIMQYKRGFFLPEQYLSNTYAKKVYQELS